ncbi:MAG: hypothetical protein ABJA10_02760 [Aestuariivirga sp.]
MRVLAFDQAPQNNGFAYGEADANLAPIWGIKTFPNFEDNDQLLMRAAKPWLTNLIAEARPNKIYFEQVLRTPNFQVFYQQVSMVCCIMYCALEAGIVAEQVFISDWRARGLGKTNKPKWGVDGDDKWLKEAAMLACADRGWLIDNHNAAEAALIWDWGCADASKAYMSATKPRVARVLYERENKDRAFNGK